MKRSGQNAVSELAAQCVTSPKKPGEPCPPGYSNSTIQKTEVKRSLFCSDASGKLPQVPRLPTPLETPQAQELPLQMMG